MSSASIDRSGDANDPADRAVAVVISTRNRPAGVLKTVESVLANDLRPAELVVVDQSGDDLTRQVLQRFAGRPDFTYVRSGKTGLARGRNEGIAQTDCGIIAMTDDDCEARSDWLSALAAAFETDARIGVVFGNVAAGPHDRTKGFVPAYAREAPYLARSMSDKHRVEGIGANMGVRRSVWAALQGFDETLGAGARFGSGEDLDFAMRVLRAGRFVYETPAAQVDHHGFRSWADGRGLIRTYMFGTGATSAKHLRLLHWAAIGYLARMCRRWVSGASLVDVGGLRPSRLLKVGAFIRGFAVGMVHPLDRGKGQFVATAEGGAGGPPARSGAAAIGSPLKRELSDSGANRLRSGPIA